MSQFNVKPERLDQCAGIMSRVGREIDTVGSILDDIDVYRCLSGLSARRIDSDIKKIMSYFQLQKTELDGFVSALNRISYNYKYTENKLCDRPVFSYRGQENDIGPDRDDSWIKNGYIREKGDDSVQRHESRDDTYEDTSSDGSKKKNRYSWSDALMKYSREESIEIGGVAVGGAISGELIGASTNTSFESGVKYDGDGNLKSISLFEMNQSAEVHAAKGKASITAGPVSSKVEGSVGQVKAKGSVGITLYEDGKLAPHLGFEAEASATGIEGKWEGKIGDENIDVHRSASFKGGTARAKANAGIGKVSYEDDDGNKKNGYGGSVEVKAEAYAAEGKIKGGFNLFGIDLDVGVTGKAGGAGVKAGGHATTGGVGVSVGAGLGLGLGIDIDIDWTGFKFGWW